MNMPGGAGSRHRLLQRVRAAGRPDGRAGNAGADRRHGLPHPAVHVRGRRLRPHLPDARRGPEHRRQHPGRQPGRADRGRAGHGPAQEQPRRAPAQPPGEVDRRDRRRRGRRRHVRRRRVRVGQPDQPGHPASRHHQPGAAGRRQGQLLPGQRQLPVAVRLPDTDFTPTTGTGPGWTATYYAGPAASGTPLGSEVVTSLNVTGTPAIVTTAGASTWSVKYTATLTAGRHRHRRVRAQRRRDASLSIGGKHIVSYGPGTGSTFTGLASLDQGKAGPFELDATGLTASGGGGSFGPPTVVA